MKKKLLASLVLFSLLAGTLPTAAFAAPNGVNQASTACICTEVCTEDAINTDCPVCSVESTSCSVGTAVLDEGTIEVPADALVIVGSTYYGVSKDWFTANNPEKATLSLAIKIPSSVTTIANDGFRDSYGSDKKKYGAVTSNDGVGGYNVVALDFSEATALTTINNQAAMNCSLLTGVLDLSNTKVTTIGKSAFSGCSALTGVILPKTLTELGTKDAGSVFKDCAGLQFVRTAGKAEDAVFDLPDNLTTIGKQSFYKCTGLPANTTVQIPASVTYVGSEVFHYTTPVTTIVVNADDASGYDGGAFKSSDYGLGKRLTIFNNKAAKDSFTPSGSNTYANSLTYQFTLHYGSEEGAATEPKLYGQAVNVCKGADGSWAVNDAYEIPEANAPDAPIGYTGGWAYNEKLLTPKTVLKPNGDALYLDVQHVLQDPTIQFIVDGEIYETEGTYPKLHIPQGTEIGVQVSHPVETDPDANVSVKFEYEWTDVWKGGSEGPRMNEEGFGRYNVFDNPDVTNTITINGYEHERTFAGNYTKEDYGDGYYLLEIYGYYAPKGGGQYKLFYKSASTVIGSDPDRTTNTAYLFDVKIEDPIIITPADITIYSGGDGYSGIVDDSGASSQTTGFPEPGYYITLPDDLNDLLGGAETAADLSGKLTLNFQDHDDTAADRTWELELYGTGKDHSSADIEINGVKRKCYIYRIKPAQVGGEDIPAHLEIIDSTGAVIESDVFTPESDQQHMDYTIRFCTDGLDLKDLTFKLVIEDEATGKETTYTRDVTLGTGSLVVRGVMDGAEAIREIASTPEDIKTTGKIAAVAPSGVTYYVNDSEVAVADPSGVRLLADSLIDNEDASQAMLDYIKSDSNDLDIPTTANTRIQAKYLDLVDSKNGNAYLTMRNGQKMTIYWPVPSDFDAGTTAHIVHFDALDRDYANASGALDENPPEQITLAAPVTVNGAKYFKFETASFSPFVLVYEKTSSGGGGGGTTRYTIKAEAGEGGSISPSGSVQVTAGADRTFTITAGADYQIADVLVDGESVGAVSSYTFKNVRANHTIQAVFEAKEQILEPDETGVSDWLNTTDHNAYMNGYDTGSFGPNDNMTRAEAAQLFYNLLLNKNVTVTVSFTDVPSDAWYSKAVNVLASLGMLNGVGGDLFEPERTITRAEFTALGMRFADLGTSGENIFSDVHPGDWFYDNVVGSIQYGWITGYSDGTFRPYSTITRAEAAVFTNRMLGRTADKDFVDQHADDLRLFPDVPETYWAYYPIVEASNSHEYKKTNGAEDWLGL